MSEGLLQPEIRELIEGKDFATLKRALAGMEVHDLAALLSDLADEELAVVFRLLPQEVAAGIFGDLEVDRQGELLSTLSSEKAAAILNDMPPDDRTELLEELPGQLAQRLLNSLRGKELEIARNLLAYPEDSIGRLMTPEYVAVRPDWDVEKVLRHIRLIAERVETVKVIYVVDDGWKLLDEVRLEDIVLADPEQKVSDLMDGQVASLVARDDQEQAVEIFKKYDAVVLPVVNRQGILVGIVTHDDVLDVAEEEDTEDIHKMAGVSVLEGGYFQTSGLRMLSKRLPWLCMLLVVETLAVLVLEGYAQLLVILAMFMPLINATAGNTGSQVAALMIRGFAVQEVQLADWWRVLLRELGRGLVMGVALGAMACCVVVIFGRSFPTAFAAALAMMVAVALANVLGAMLPFFFKRVGMDPAVTSGPFIACLMDVSSIVIFFSIAAGMLEAIG